MAKILVVEDDTPLSRVVDDLLQLEHHSVEIVSTSQDAAHRLKLNEYDLIILDWQLPDGSGVDVLREFRAHGGKTPVLFLTGKDTIIDKETGFDAGADDYLTKPFHGRELAARVRALLRRPPIVSDEVLTVGAISIDRSNYRVTKDGSELHLVPTEFALLEFLMRNPSRVFSAKQLLDRVWSVDSDATEEAVTTCVKRLRKKIDVDGEQSMIRTVYGVGYKLEPPGSKS